jgi:hypothetical protein
MNQIRLSLVLILILVVHDGFCQQTHTIPKVTIKDRGLLLAIDEYHHTFAREMNEGKAVMIVRYIRTGDEKYFLAYKVYRDEVQRDPPSFYSVVNGKVVLLYTGLERNMQFSDPSFKMLFKDLKDFLTETEILYNPVIWEVVSKPDGFEKKVVSALPY